MKTLVVNKRENTQVPFLRGILTRALMDAGMSFEDAFNLATDVRRDLADTEEISSDDLRERVLKKAGAVANEAVLEYYRVPHSAPTRILVRSVDGGHSPFSRGRHVRFLQSSGMRNSSAEEITGKIYEQLLAQGAQSISSSRLGYITYLCLKEEVGRKAARRYVVWTQFERGDRPLLLLLGGAVGTGKSSMATEIGHCLGIVRTQSTDMLREVMRMMIPERLLPVLHTSSFEAWKRLPIPDTAGRDKDALVAEGFRSQAELLFVPCEAVLQRAERESVSLILEGVHALPELLNGGTEDSNVIRVHVTLAVLSSSDLKSRLRGRSSQEPKRRARRYLKNFDSIWRLQSFLLSEADRNDAPIITNDDRDKAIRAVINVVIDELSKSFDGEPRRVFGDVLEELGEQNHTSEWQSLVPLLINR